jgi:hypothetical protein
MAKPFLEAAISASINMPSNLDRGNKRQKKRP